MKDVVKGKVVIKLGDLVDSDQMSPPEYMWQFDPESADKGCLVNYDPEFSQRVRPGDFVVAGQAFGYGHLHMRGLMGFEKLGVAAVIAESVSPGWYRGAVAGGFPVVVCPSITQKANEGDDLEINVKTGNIKNLTTGDTIKAEPIPAIIREIIDAGGTAAYTDKKLKTT